MRQTANSKNSPGFLFNLVLILTFALSQTITAHAQSEPEAIIPVGDGPYALDISGDGTTAIVSLLFPAEDEDPNLFRVNLESSSVTGSYRFGRRLFRIGAIDPNRLRSGNAGLPVALVNGDVDKLTIVDLDAGAEIEQVGTGQNPSNVEIVQRDAPLIGSTFNLAVVANGTGGSLSFIDLDTMSRLGEYSAGNDPRATATIPGGPYLMTVLRGENVAAILDLSSGNVNGIGELARIGVGQNPTDIKVTSDGLRAVVANLTNNTISILDIGDPSNPRLVRNPATNAYQFPVGVQPTSIALTPDGETAFVANAGSPWVTVVDLTVPQVAGVVTIQQPGDAIASASAAVGVTPDGTKLIVAESGNAASLLVYDIDSLELEPVPEIEIPDEPGTEIYLERNEGESCGYYTAGLTLQEGAADGFWGMEVLTTAGNRLLEGGINLGGAFDADARNPGFGAFNIANRAQENQIVEIAVDATALPTVGYPEENLGLSVQIVNSAREPVTGEVTGSDHIELQAELEPGFYIVRIKSLPGSPRGTFLMSMITRFVDRSGGGFQGGANVGGYITRKADGSSTTAFAGFCLSESQNVAIRTEAGTSRGATGAGNLILTIRDRSRDLVQEISNSVPPPPAVEPPPPPSLDGLRPDLYVDAGASSTGTGSASRPFRSITDAVGKAARSGDVILVRPGIYSPSRTGEVLPIGSPGPGLNRIPAGVRLIGSGAEVTIIDAEMALRDGSPVNAVGVGSDNVRIAGFTVRNSSAVGIFVLNADRVQIDRNFFVGNGRFAVGASGTGGLVLSGNVARANNETGFSVANTISVSVASPPAGCPDAFGACILDNIANEHSRDGFLFTTGGDYHILRNAAFNNGISGIEVNNRNSANPLSAVIRDNLTSNNGGVLFPFSGTGILVTEFAHATEITGNQADNNRPGGIAVFEDSSADLIADNVIRYSKQNGLIVQKRSTATEIADNQIANSGLSGLFVENDSVVETVTNNTVQGNGSCSYCTAAKGGLAILGRSEVGVVRGNSFNRNSLGAQIANESSAGVVTQNGFDSNLDGGVLVRAGSAIPDFSDNSVRNNRGAEGASLVLDNSTATIRRCDINSLEGDAIILYEQSELAIEDSIVSGSGLNGFSVYSGSLLTLQSVEVDDNGDTGVLASGAGTDVTINDSQIRNNAGYGVNAQNDAIIRCQGSTTVTGNGLGNVLGNVQGCN